MALTKVSGEVIKRPLILTNDASISGILTVGTGSTTTTIDGSFEYPTIRPTLDLNFAATKTLDSRISFSRDSIGTYTDELGIVRTVSNNTPRFDHDPTTGESLGLLIEESRTNLVTYSENFDSWGTAYRTTISLNAAISPSSQLNASKFNVTTDTGYHARSLSVAGGTYTVSIFAKAGEYDGIQITGTNTTEDHACFNLVDGTAYHSGTNVTNIRIENYGNGWYRCSARLPLTNGNLFVAITDGTTTSWLPSFAGSSVTDGIYIWGAQIEAGSFATSYIPTSGSTVTRTTDIAKITGTNFTSFYTAEEFTLYGDGRSITGSSDVGGNPALVSIDDNTNNNRFILRRWDPGGATPRSGFTFRYRRTDINLNLDAFPYGTSGGYDATGDLPDWQDASLHKIVFGVNNNSQVPQDIAGYGDGFDANFAVTNPGGYTGTEILTPYTGATQMQIGFGAASARWNGQISSIKYYPKRLPDAQLKGLTHH